MIPVFNLDIFKRLDHLWRNMFTALLGGQGGYWEMRRRMVLEGTRKSKLDVERFDWVAFDGVNLIFALMVRVKISCVINLIPIKKDKSCGYVLNVVRRHQLCPHKERNTEVPRTEGQSMCELRLPPGRQVRWPLRRRSKLVVAICLHLASNKFFTISLCSCSLRFWAHLLGD